MLRTTKHSILDFPLFNFRLYSGLRCAYLLSKTMLFLKCQMLQIRIFCCNLWRNKIIYTYLWLNFQQWSSFVRKNGTNLHIRKRHTETCWYLNAIIYDHHVIFEILWNYLVKQQTNRSAGRCAVLFIQTRIFTHLSAA